MKGIVFTLLENCINAEYGEDTWDDMLMAADLDGAYTSLGNYDDQEAVDLIAAGAQILDIEPVAVERWFGEAAMPHLANSYPEFFSNQGNTRSFVLTLNDIIHPEVRKLYPGADVPDFDFDESSPNELIMHYESGRKMCAFAEGLVRGAANHFGEQVTISHTSCMKDGDKRCSLRISFE